MEGGSLLLPLPFSSFQTGLVQPSEVSGPLYHLPLSYHSHSPHRVSWGHQGKVPANPKLCFPAPPFPPSLSPLLACLYSILSLYSRNIMFAGFTPTL